MSKWIWAIGGVALAAGINTMTENETFARMDARPVPAVSMPSYDMVSKAYMSELLIGAVQGLKSGGWENKNLEYRARKVERFAAGFHDEEIRAAGRKQALNGQWTEEVLTAHLDVLETPREVLDAPPSVGSKTDERSFIARVMGPPKEPTRAYVEAAGRLLDIEWAGHKILQDAAKSDRPVIAVLSEIEEGSPLKAAVARLGYAEGPGTVSDIHPSLLDDSGRSRYRLGARVAYEGEGAVREKVHLDLLNDPAP